MERVALVRAQALRQGDSHLVAECDQQLHRWGVVLDETAVQVPEPAVMERAIPKRKR